jgi:RNA polymerase sigma-70 factor (ECF subfamily)
MTFSKKDDRGIQTGVNQSNQASPPDFEDTFEQNWNRVCSVLYRLVGDRAEAEDLALGVFLRLYRRPPNRGHNLRGWLYRVATHMGLNALRARKRRDHYEEQAGLEILHQDQAWDPEKTMEQSEQRSQVRAVLARMKPRSAHLLILRHSGLSYAEVANALEVSPASVGTLLARAEKEFEQIYRELEKET